MMKIGKKGLSTAAIMGIVVIIVVVVAIAVVLLPKLGPPMTPGATTTATPSITTTTTTTTPTTSSTTTTAPTTTITTPPTETTTTTEFNGPTYTRDLGGGSGLEVDLSSPSVNVGGALQMRVELTGPAAWNVGELSFTVINSSGENVYDVIIWLSHATLASGESPPQEYILYYDWFATSSPTAGNVEVTPGTYSFTLMPSGENAGVTGTIEVVTTTTTTVPLTTTTTVTSLTCTLDVTSENMSSTMTLKAKDIGIDNKLKVREEGIVQTMGMTENVVYIINEELQKAWWCENGQWMDISASFSGTWSTYVTSFQEFMGHLSGWTGGDITNTENGVTVRIYNIVLNPVLEDSLFVYTGTATTLPTPVAPLTTTISIVGATSGSTTLTITHAGGDPIRTAFYENTGSVITADNWANMEVRINGAKVITASGATLDNLLLTPPSSHDFSVGDILVLPLNTSLSSGDVITVVYTPANQILLTVTVP
jgi:hypothetical protein